MNRQALGFVTPTLEENAPVAGGALLLLTKRQACERLGVNRHKLEEWLGREDDPLPHLRDNRIIRLLEVDVVEWVRRQYADAASR